MENKTDEETGLCGRGKRTKIAKRFSFPPKSDSSPSLPLSKKTKIHDEKIVAKKSTKEKLDDKGRSMKTSDRVALELIKANKAQKRLNAKISPLSRRQADNFVYTNPGSQKVLITSVDVHKPEDYDEIMEHSDDCGPSKSTSIKENTNPRIQFSSSNRSSARPQNNLSQRSIEAKYQSKIELLNVEKASLITRNEELERKNERLEMENESFDCALKDAERELHELKNRKVPERDLQVDLIGNFQIFRENVREDLINLAEQLHTSIVEDLSGVKSTAVIDKLHQFDHLKISNGQVQITENISIDVETYMKAAQAPNMRKRANIAIRGIWKPCELMQFVLKRVGNDDTVTRHIITQEDILILHVTVTKMQEHKFLSTDTEGMDLTNLPNWLAYQAKMARLNARVADEEKDGTTTSIEPELRTTENENNDCESSESPDSNNERELSEHCDYSSDEGDISYAKDPLSDTNDMCHNDFQDI
ncbi:uncharacterized protein LOC122859552 [Aphidius gifuensis]|uniref:uncharacterized protein LOC122859552 n=1 Tax=Aphidius gifuensis TaxID=684658 RepID=UPI001CDB5358|nr:uncharacterized protein LOC122859552 [Aphidius gifuensis]